MKMFYRLAGLIGFYCVTSADVSAITCNSAMRESTPNSRFVIYSNEVVLDKNTGLMWRRCAQGRSGSDCKKGVDFILDWDDALTQAASSTYAGYTDWRLPNVKELLGITEEKCASPALNLAVFPMPTGANYAYWTASPRQGVGSANADLSLQVDFLNGQVNARERESKYAVRLVRDAVVPTLSGIYFNASSLDFAILKPGESKSLTSNLVNLSATSIKLVETIKGGINPDPFSYTTTCGTQLAAGQSCTYTITFKPTDNNPAQGELVVTTNLGNVALPYFGGATR